MSFNLPAAARLDAGALHPENKGLIMVRKPKDEEAMPTAGDNITDETRKIFWRESVRAQQAIDEAAEVLKAAKDVLNSVLKNAEAAGLQKRAIKDALKLRLVDRDVLIAEERDRARFLALSGIWPSIQTDMFASLTPIDLTAETTAEVAFDNGHRCGLKGESRSINPHVPATEQYDAWDRGWLQGQGSNVEKLGGRKPRKAKT